MFTLTSWFSFLLPPTSYPARTSLLVTIFLCQVPAPHSLSILEPLYLLSWNYHILFQIGIFNAVIKDTPNENGGTGCALHNVQGKAQKKFNIAWIVFSPYSQQSGPLFADVKKDILAQIEDFFTVRPSYNGKMILVFNKLIFIEILPRGHFCSVTTKVLNIINNTYS